MKPASSNFTLRLRLAAVAGAVTLTGCAVAPTAPTVMVLPGAQKTPPQYQLDNARCQQQAQAVVAPQVDAANNQAAASAVIGTAIGAAVGALLGSGYYYSPSAAAWGAGTGLLMGSSVGAGQAQASSYSLQQRYDIAFMQCMYQLGNQVPGQVAARRPAPAARAWPAVPPANQPAPTYPPPNTPAPSFPSPNTPAPNFPPPNTPAPVGAGPA